LLWLYNGAEALIFPTLYEGFGAPPLEAMACGTPVVASNVTAVPEVVGDAAVLIDPYDVEQMAEGIHQILSDHGLRAELVRKGLQRARSFTWEKAALAVLAAYRAACPSGPS